MCKHCKLIIVGSKSREKQTVKNVLRLKDGSQIFDLYLNRYIVETEDIHRSNLEINISVDMDGGEYVLKHKEIPIKYCPFCGEEL